MNCPTCTAPLGPGKAVCSYCGGTVDVDFAGQTLDTTQPPAQPRICCACAKAMDALNAGTTDSPFYIDRCPTCLGLFLDTGELESVIERNVTPVYAVDHLALARLTEHNGDQVVRYRKCPVCSKFMNRVNYGQSSGVIADQCRDHGVYLDAGELRRILAWVRAGGRLAAAQKVAAAADATRPPSEISLPFLGDVPQEPRTPLSHLATFLLKLLGGKVE